jgi:hypothetical protein
MKTTFKKYLTEVIPFGKTGRQILLCGGNVVFDGESASPINLDLHDRVKTVKIIKDGLEELNRTFKSEKGLPLWKPSLLTDNLIFSGSTKHLFDDAIDEKKLKKHKSKFGDVDLMIDLDLKGLFLDFMSDKKHKNFGEMKNVGHKVSGDQVITLFHIGEFDINVQLDFEGVLFEKGEPTEWAHFSHSSSFDDIANGVKGAFHKLLLSSLMAPKKVEAIEQMKTKQKDIISGTHALSVKGLREKYKITGKDEATGKPIMVDTKSRDFITDFNEIFKMVFDKKPTEAQVKKFWSFKGMLDLIDTLMDKNDKEDVIESFVDKLFGDGAQGLYRGDENRDLEEKMVALRYLEDRLHVDFNQDKLEDLQVHFYKKTK